jgi:hypothetical protein
LGNIPFSPLEEIFVATPKDFAIAYAGVVEGLLLTLVMAVVAITSS